MSRFQLKISCPSKNQKDLKLNKKEESIHINTEILQKLGLTKMLNRPKKKSLNEQFQTHLNGKKNTKAQ